MKEKRNKVITIRVDENTHATLTKMAEKDDRTISYIVNKILTEYAKKEG